MPQHLEPSWISDLKAAYPAAFADMAPLDFSCDLGWRDLISNALALAVAADPQLRVARIKEKLGTLRIYVDTASPDAWEALQDAERRSAVTCERCGEPGTLDTRHPWWLTLCPACRTRRDNEEPRP